MAKKQKYWLFTEIPDEKRITQGNAGYVDETGVIYRYDNSVPNHLNPNEGDRVVFRKSKNILGWALICEIRKKIGVKERRRCPECKKTKLRLRKRTKPPWRCLNCEINFTEPIVQDEEAKLFEAHFHDTFQPLDKRTDVDLMWPLTLKLNKQHSIQELDPEGTCLLLNIPSDLNLLNIAKSIREQETESHPGELDFSPGHIQKEAGIKSYESSRGTIYRHTQHNRIQDSGFIVQGTGDRIWSQ